MMIIDTNTDEQVEDLGYFAKECSILGKIRLNSENKKLITLTYDRTKQRSFLNYFDVDSEKILGDFDYKNLTSKK